MKTAIYARVSTKDKDQNPETQLIPLRDAGGRLGLKVVAEYIDTASAQDTAHRYAWRRLLDDAARKKFEVVLVWKLDRAFRSVKHMNDTLHAWVIQGITFRCLNPDIDMSTAPGRLLLNILAAVAEFEGDLIKERVQAGMTRAQSQGTRSGKPIGRPKTDIDVQNLLNAYVNKGSVRAAAREIGCNPGLAYRRLRDTGIFETLPPEQLGKRRSC